MEVKHGGKNVKIILSTHSPYILRQLESEEIRILLRESPNNVEIYKPDSYMGYAKILGMDINQNKILLVEDIAASIFTKIWIKSKGYYFFDEVEISIAGSDIDIKNALKFPKVESFKIYGLFDGDIKEYDEKQKNEKNKIIKTDDIKSFRHEFGYLPIKNVEEDFKKYFNLDRKYFSKYFSMTDEQYLVTINMLDGEDKHDWLEELSREVAKSKENIIEIFYRRWFKDQENKAKAKKAYKEIKTYLQM